mgnify:CR=1 FL=1
MKVQAVNSRIFDNGLTHVVGENSKTDYSYVNPTLKNDKFEKISFGGDYADSLKFFAQTVFKTDREVEDLFIKMLKALIKDTSIAKQKGFEEIVGLYEKSGFRGLLTELWKAYPSKELAQILPKEQEFLALAGEKETPVLSIFNSGRQGFWNAIFNNKNAPRDMELIFTEPTDKYVATFSLSKKGNLQIVQRNNHTSTWSEFYLSTGAKKQEAVHTPDGFPETTYYKKDGTPDAIENHMHGGPAIPLW